MSNLMRNSGKLLTLLLCVTLAASIGALVDSSYLSSSGYSLLMLPKRLAFYALAYYYSSPRQRPWLILMIAVNEMFVVLQHTGVIALW